MLKWLKLSHHRHSGRISPHEYTSYLPLGILLAVVGLTLGFYTANAEDHPDPIPAAISVTGIMPGNPPTTAAVIISPVTGQRFSSTPVAVSGTCPKDTLVELFKNDIFAGSTPCTNEGTFVLDIDLLVGSNTLIAKVYDSLNQVGPDSNVVTVYYDALPAQTSPLSSSNLGGSQLLINSDAAFRGIFPNQELTVPISILGGKAPYAINIQWGDSTNKVVSRDSNVTFNSNHAYTKAGTYKITIQATDANGRVAFLTVTAIVNGQPSTIVGATSQGTKSSTTNTLLVLWPLYTAILAAVISFWLGEQREKRVLRLRGLLLTSN